MYRIMIAQSKRKNYETLYQYLTTNIDGVVSPLELSSKEELDSRIEKMLNEDGYAKDDLLWYMSLIIRLMPQLTLMIPLLRNLPAEKQCNI